jgi:hypothetical protein
VALALPNNYYMGIEQIATNTFVWLDGSFIGNTTPSNSSPYKHWSPSVYTQLQTYPTYTCFVSYNTHMYNTFIGNLSSWTHISTWSTSYYNTTAPTWMSWYNAGACTTAYAAVCEVPIASYACTGAPPPAYPPPVAGSACKCSAEVDTKGWVLARWLDLQCMHEHPMVAITLGHALLPLRPAQQRPEVVLPGQWQLLLLVQQHHGSVQRAQGRLPVPWRLSRCFQHG